MWKPVLAYYGEIAKALTSKRYVWAYDFGHLSLSLNDFMASGNFDNQVFHSRSYFSKVIYLTGREGQQTKRTGTSKLLCAYTPSDLKTFH